MSEENQENFTVVTDPVAEFEQQEAVTEPAAEEQPTDEHAADNTDTGDASESETGSDEPATETGAQDADQNTEEGGEEGQEEQRPQGRYNRRISKLTKQAKDAEDRAAEAEAQLREIRETQAAKPAKDLDPADFDDFEDYLTAAREQGGNEQQPVPVPAPDKSLQEYQAAAKEVMDSIADWDNAPKDYMEKIQSPDLKMSGEMVMAMAETDHASQIAYHLATHADKSAEIADMSPRQQAIEIGRIEARLSTKPAPKTTAAPRPIKPVGGSDASKKDVGDMSYGEYEADRNKQERRGGPFW